MSEIYVYLIVDDFVVDDFLEIYVVDFNMFSGWCDFEEFVWMGCFLVFKGCCLFVYVKVGFIDIDFVVKGCLEGVLLIVLKGF